MVQAILTTPALPADSNHVIIGTMPKWRRYVNTTAYVMMYLLFGGFGFVNARLLVSTAHTVPLGPELFFTLLYMLVSGVGIGLQVWFQRRMVAEFRYDGSTLQFQTLGITEPQIRVVTDIEAIRAWRGRGGPLGYRLLFRDRQKLYIEFSVSNSTALVNRIRADLRL